MDVMVCGFLNRREPFAKNESLLQRMKLEIQDCPTITTVIT